MTMPKKISKKKIAILVHSLKVGGMERVASELANSYAMNADIDLHMILYGIERDIFYSLDKNITVHKPEYEFNNKQRTLSTIKTLFFLRRKIIELNPDTVLSFGEYWNNMVLLASLGLRVPVFIADRSAPMKDLGKFQNLLRKYLYPTSEGLIVQTDKASKIYKQKFKNLGISVIGNPTSSMPPKKIIQREKSILTVGRLIKTKHIDRLIKIFSELDAPDWKLVIVGDNDKKQNTIEKLESLAKDLNIADQVIFVGNQKDVISYYLKSKIFSFTSSSEGFPNVIIEAMSAGLPVVAYDCMAGPSEIITNGEDGFLIPLFDDEMFVKKLEFLIKNENVRIGMGFRASLNSVRYNIDIISQQFLKVILN